MKQYDTALIIGRFQPFHNGHLYLLKKAAEKAEKIIFGIGTTRFPQSDDPFSFTQRKTMIDQVIDHEKVTAQVSKVIDLPDFPSDEDWLKEVKERVGFFSVVVGNNDWTNGIFKADGYPIMRVPYWKRFLLEGTRIRALMREKQPWQDRVPDYLVPEITALMDTNMYFSTE